MAAISKEEYLKRYLSNSDSGKKKKKRKIPKVASKRPTSIIVDDDITLEDVKVNHEENEMNEFEVDADEAPAVYEDDGVTKISLETFKKREEDQRNKWAPINKNTQLSPSKEVGQKSNYDSDHSPPRIMKRRRQDTPDLSPRGGLMANSSDQSPLRNRCRRIEADNSPPRSRRRHDSGDSIPEEAQNQLHVHDRSTTSRIRNDSPDLSPLRSGPNSGSTARRVRNDSPDLSPPRSGSNNRDSGGRRVRNDSVDLSPPRSGRKRDSTVRRGQNDSPDLSPPRSRSHGDSSARRTKSDSPDLSPPRSRMNRGTDHSLARKRTNSDSESPPRKHGNSDSDQSPPRREKRPERGSKSKEITKSGSEDTMASGRKAGLLTASDLKIENERKRVQEAVMFSKMDPSVSGKGSETVYRDKMGRKKDIKMDRIKRREEERKEMEENEKFMEWGRGVTQTKQNKEKVADYLHEVDKPLARYRDDKDLEMMLKEKEREDDPMLAYMKQKKKKQDIKAGKKEKPVYKGPEPPPNRFNIRPGYRWDGVDRSNGFERKRFAMLANKMATQTQAYKWSTEDM